MPEEVLKKLNRRLLPQWKICFFTALVVGLLTHFYKLTNWLPNWDSLVFRYDAQKMLGLGRWFLPVACGGSSFYDLPWLNGILALVFHALGAVCICRMFNVRKGITAGLIGAVVVGFPTVTSVLLYNYVADGYALSFLLACLAASCLVEEKPKYLAAVVLIALSVGIYQAYITVTIMLLLCHLICQAVQTQATVKSLLVKCGKLLLAGAAGMILYYAVLLLLLKVTGTELLEYQGANSVGALSWPGLYSAFYTVKQSFVAFVWGTGGWSVFRAVNCIVYVLSVLFYIWDGIKNRLSVGKWLLVAVLTAFLPICASCLALINGNVDYHNLMKMGFYVFYLMFLLQYERTQCKSERGNGIKAWAILLVSLVLVFNQAVLANVSYHKLQMAYERSYGTLIRIADRIEQTEGAADCDRIMVVGSLPESEAYSADVSLEMTGTTDGLILRADDEVVGQSVFCSAINDYCGTSYRFVAGEEKLALMQRMDVDSLGSWPHEQAVSVADGVLVVKLGPTDKEAPIDQTM